MVNDKLLMGRRRKSITNYEGRDLTLPFRKKNLDAWKKEKKKGLIKYALNSKFKIYNSKSFEVSLRNAQTNRRAILVRTKLILEA
jgi:hypothetical protein